ARRDGRRAPRSSAKNLTASRLCSTVARLLHGRKEPSMQPISADTAPPPLTETERPRAPKSAAKPLHIVPVRTAGDLRRFIKVPWRIYANEPNWIPPLLLEQRHQFSKKSPFFEHARAQFWI